MKKAKIMLVAIAVLATVGGALAFKVTNKFKQPYCILTTQNGARTTCSMYTESKVDQANANALTYYYIVTGDASGCLNNIVCTTTSSKLTVD